MGWKGEYYNGANFMNLALTRIDPNVYAPNNTPDPDGAGPLATTNLNCRLNPDFLIPDFSEDYTFTFRQDDGVGVYINGQLVIDGWNLGGIPRPVLPYGSMFLNAGVKYPVRVEFSQVGGGASWDLEWNSASQTGGINAVIPSANVIPANANTVVNCKLDFGAKAGKLTNNGGGTLVVNGVLQGSGGVQFESNGGIALNGINTFTGGATLAAGLIQSRQRTSALPGIAQRRTVTVNRNVSLMGALGVANLSPIIANNINVADDFYIGNSPNQLTLSGTILLQNGSRVVTCNNAVTRNTGAQTGSVINVTGTVTDGGNGYSFIKNGSGTMQFSSQPTQLYTGPTIVLRGTLLLGVDNALESNE